MPFRRSPTLHPVYRRLLKLTLEELRVIEDHLGQLDQQMADLLAAHHDAVQRLAEVHGLGSIPRSRSSRKSVRRAATFPSPKHLASWMPTQPMPTDRQPASIVIVNWSRCPRSWRRRIRFSSIRYAIAWRPGDPSSQSERPARSGERTRRPRPESISAPQVLPEQME